MLKNEKHDFQVELINKTWKIYSRDGSQPVKEITQPAIKLTFNCTVGYGRVKSYNSDYGSQPCYDEEYAGETDYEYEVDFDLLSEEIFDDQEYCSDLINRNPDLFYTFYEVTNEGEEDWIWEPDEQSAYDLIMDAIEHKKNFLNDIQEKAQEAYDNEPEDVPDYD